MTFFAEATRACVRVAASAYRDLLRATRRESRALAVPRVVVVARRLAEYGFFQEASALLRVILFDENNHALLESGALTNELYVFLTELCCEAMYAGTFVEPFAGEENFRAARERREGGEVGGRSDDRGHEERGCG